MYQLSHLLTDQKSVMTALLELSITGENAAAAAATPTSATSIAAAITTPEQDTNKNLAFLLEKVEGCSVSSTQNILYTPISHRCHDAQ